MATGCESQRWGTLADPRPGRGHGDEWIVCVGSIRRASPHPVDDYLLLSKSVPVIPRYGHQICSVFLWETWLKKRAETTEGYLPSELGMSRLITDHRSLSRVRASFLYMHCEPKNFFCSCCCVSRSTFHEFPFFCFFLLYSSVAQTLKKVGPLDCKLRLLRLRRRSLGGKISVAEVMHLLTLKVFSANFRVVLVVVPFLFYFFSFIFSLTFFFLYFSLW